MTRIRFSCSINCDIGAFAGAAQQSMKFEDAAAMLAASCGKDIDDNCRGVTSSDAPEECWAATRTWCGEVQGRFSASLGAIQQRIARTSLVKLCNWELKHLCGEVREDPVRVCMPVWTRQEGDPNCNKRDQRKRGIA